MKTIMLFCGAAFAQTFLTLLRAMIVVSPAFILANRTQAQQLMRVDVPPPGGPFYSIQKTNQPPLPFNPFPELEIYSWGEIFFFDDSQVDYEASMNLMSVDPPPMPGPGGGGGGSSSNNVPPAYGWGSNDLWLEITGMTNTTGWFIIHTPTNSPYDLFHTTNLTVSVGGLNLTNRTWLYRTASGETNLTVTNLWSAQGCFNLGTMLDSDGDGLTDAYEYLVSHTNPSIADTDGDGLSDYGELVLGTNPNVNESASTPGRVNYVYCGDGWLRTVFGARAESISPDAEGNILQASP